MKHLFFAGLLLSAIAYKSQMQNIVVKDSPVTQQMEDTATIAGTWHLVPVLSSDTAAGKIPALNFNIKDNRFSGNNGCNDISGSFFIKADALRFGEDMISTKMLCPGYNEKSFVENLLKTNRYVIKDGVLELMYNTTILSKWTRSVDASNTKKA